MSLPKARVQLLDPATGAVISDVDILSVADVVSYSNETKTVSDFRGIPKGSTFDSDTSVKYVLDKIIYPHINPSIVNISANTKGLEDGVTEDTVIINEKYVSISDFTLNAKIEVGSETVLNITLKQYDGDSAYVDSVLSTVKVIPGSDYIVSFNIESFLDDRSYLIEINDGVSGDLIVSPKITFSFISPIFVGFCDDTIIDQDLFAILDTESAITYFNTMISNNDKFIEKKIVDVRDMKTVIKSMIVEDPLYATTRKYPFILVPNTYNKPVSIRDTNRNDITGLFTHNSDIEIRSSALSVETDKYTVYASRSKYLVGLSSVGKVSYIFNEDNIALDMNGSGSPLLGGFDMLNEVPADYRTVVNTYEELSKISYPYKGLITYVKDQHTFFEFNGTRYLPTNQQIFFETDENKKQYSDYNLEIGNWNDIIINTSNGQIYQKLENRRWEYKGTMLVSKYLEDKISEAVDDYLSKTEIDGKAATVDVGEVVTGLPGSSVIITNSGNTTDAILNFTIPRGQPGINGTIELGTVTVGPIASITNSGTDTNMVLDIVLPEGSVGDPGRSATINIGEVSKGESFDFTNVGSETDAVIDITVPAFTGSKVVLDGREVDVELNTIRTVEVKSIL